MKHPPTLLIDGDIIAYKAATSVERSVSFDGDNHHTIASMEEARKIVEDSLASLCKGFKTSNYIVALTDGINWRTKIYPPYKANRQGKPRPICLGPLRDAIMAEHPTFLRPTLEADDVLGILATSTRIIKHPGEKIIVSVDKDMMSIPGVFHCLNDKTTTEISEEDADRWHMYQTLTGDAVDGYPGCPGVGPVKATRVLAEGSSYEEWWPLVVKAYEKADLTEEDALVQARVARICRVSDYDFIRKEVKLWQHP